MKFGSLFAGIGGFDLGLERAGMQCAWQVEIDDYCQRVLTKHWPDVPKFRDIRDCGSHNLASVDLVCGGFPCQPFSLAGKRGGTADDRYLWPEMFEVIGQIKPAWVVGENVPGIIGMGLDQVLDDLESIGYETQTIVFPAASLGAWHNRSRVWIMAHNCQFIGWTRQESIRPWYQTSNDGEDVPNASGERLQISTCREFGSIHGSNGSHARSQFSGGTSKARECWAVEPDVGRVAHGVPSRVDRLRALGNAIVPQCAEFIGRKILSQLSQNCPSDSQVVALTGIEPVLSALRGRRVPLTDS